MLLMLLTVIFVLANYYSANHDVSLITAHLLIRQDAVEDDRKKN